MVAEEDDEKLLRSVALKNAQSILAARQRAERELIESNEALERKTEELAQANRRLILLNRMANDLILGAAPQDQLKAALAAVAHEIGATHYFQYSIDEKEPGILTLGASGGLDQAQECAFRRIGLGQHLAGRVAQSRCPWILEDANQCDDEATAVARTLSIRAYAGLPLLAHGQLFGMIAFGSTRQSRFTTSDIELLKMLADQLAGVLDRTQLLQRLRDGETRYRAALITGRMGSWETDFVAGTRAWTEEGMALFGLSLPDGRGHVGGDADEFRAALHPDDRHLVQHFHEVAQKEDSFSAEYRVVRPDGAILWLSGRGRVVARGADGKAQRLVNIVADVTDRKKAEEHIQLLMREISHRSKNLLAVVQAIAGQTARTAGTLQEFDARFSRRLQGLATSHDLLVHENWHGASLADLARQQLAPFADVGSSRLELEGPEIFVTTEAAQAIGLALHELATNAIKYGSLSAPAGKVRLAWAFDNNTADAPRLRISWVERGGPPVDPPTEKGFGHVVIESVVAQSVNGEVSLEFASEGLTWTLSMPTTNLVSEARKSHVLA